MINLNASSMLSATAAPAVVASAAAPVAPATALATPAVAAATGDGAQGAPVPAAPQDGAPFAQWLGLALPDNAPDNAVDAAPDDEAATPAAGADADPATAQTGSDADASAASAQAPAAAPAPLLAAMAMPLMPVPAPQFVAPPSGVGAGSGSGTGTAPVARASRAGAPVQLAASAPPSTDTGFIALPAIPVQPAQAAPEHAAVHATQAAAPTVANAPARQEAAADPSAAPLQPAINAAAPAPQPPAQPAASVALAGPAPTWRQALHEALGDRIDLQLAKNAEQAVIRLDPPNLGRIEIAIRHAAGSLEVTLSATHGEVLRQLHAVSDGLRNDLAQRQFTEVAVNVAPAPRGQSGAPASGQEGRGGRHGGQQQEQQQSPGHALRDGEARSTSAFSLT